MTLPFVVVLATTLVVMVPNRLSADIYTATRLAALLGYQLIFIAVLSSAFVRPLTKAFGQPFVKLHHIVALSGLALICLHPVLASLSWNTYRILLPNLNSASDFFQWSGSPAFDLLLLAVLAAAFRRRLKGAWRVIHMLTYVALLLGTIHATTATFTTDLQGGGVRWAAWLLALGGIVVFALRRSVLRRRRRRAL